jgi:hypothetical protein
MKAWKRETVRAEKKIMTRIISKGKKRMRSWKRTLTMKHQALYTRISAHQGRILEALPRLWFKIRIIACLRPIFSTKGAQTKGLLQPLI